MSETTTYKLTLAYNGTNYAGFARQKESTVRTVQEELESALATALRLGAPPLTVCAGRTDAGVHALGQVISFDLAVLSLDERGRAQLVRSLNALTPLDIVVRDLQVAPTGFSARFDAIAREYRYRIAATPEPPLFSAPFAWHVPQALDRTAMQEAAAALIGEHDFRSFCVAASATEDKNTVRTIQTLDFLEEAPFGEPLLILRCIGNAFLHSMVRVITGTLVEVGLGKRRPADISAIIAAKDRSAAGQTAPACGLTLYKVDY